MSNDVLLKLLRASGRSSDAELAERVSWSEEKVRAQLAALFRTRTRDEWCALLEGTDSCFAPVLSLGEAPSHAHNRARGTFVERDGVTQPAAAPRFSRTPGSVGGFPPDDADGALSGWGFEAEELAHLRKLGVLG